MRHWRIPSSFTVVQNTVVRKALYFVVYGINRPAGAAYLIKIQGSDVVVADQASRSGGVAVTAAIVAISHVNQNTVFKTL